MSTRLHSRPGFAPAVAGISASIVAVVLALGVSMLAVGLAGSDPMAAARSLWEGAFGSRRQIASTLVYVTPLSLVAIGWIIVYVVGRISVGFDGQMVVAGIAVTWAGVHLGSLPGIVHLVVGLVVAMTAGALWAGIAAYLWAARGVNEIISTLLLNFIAAHVLGWAIRGPLQEPTGGFAQSLPVHDSAKWPNLLSGTTLTYAFLFAVILVLLTPFALRRTRFGYQMRLTGANSETARRMGIPVRRLTVWVLLASGALAGLAGSSLVIGGQSGVLTDGFNQELGFYGIVVALLARNSAWGVLPAALLVAALLQGGPFMQAQVGVPSALVSLTQGLVVVFVAAFGAVANRWARTRSQKGGYESDIRSEPAGAMS